MRCTDETAMGTPRAFLGLHEIPGVPVYAQLPSAAREALNANSTFNGDLDGFLPSIGILPGGRTQTSQPSRTPRTNTPHVLCGLGP
jgi:hypothetical protein